MAAESRQGLLTPPLDHSKDRRRFSPESAGCGPNGPVEPGEPVADSAVHVVPPAGSEPPVAAEPPIAGSLLPDPPPVSHSYAFQPAAMTPVELTPEPSPAVAAVPRIVGPDPGSPDRRPLDPPAGPILRSASHRHSCRAATGTVLRIAIIEPTAAPADEIARLPPAAPPRTWSISFARIGEELVAWFKTLLSAAVYATLIVTFGFQVARVEARAWCRRSRIRIG